MTRPTHILLHKRFAVSPPDWEEWLIKVSRINEVHPAPIHNPDKDMQAMVFIAGEDRVTSVRESPLEIQALMGG